MNDVTHTRASMAGGILTILLANVSSADLMKTALLSAIGAAVSFGMSHFLKWLISRRQKGKGESSS